jgi:hypothetical protein
MRQATYQATGSAGTAEISVFYFGVGQGGGVEANISRWVGQFQGLAPDAAKRSQSEVNGLKHSVVTVESGTFASGMPGASGPQENWGMRAAVVEAKSGQYFFKMSGPAAVVQEQSDAFAQLLASVREKS